MTDAEQVAALRERIRQAGENVRALRLGLGGVIVTLALLMALGALAMNLQFPDEAEPLTIASVVVPQWIAAPVAWAVQGPLGALLIACPLAFGVRALLRRRIGKALSRIPDEQRSALLLSFGPKERGDTRKVVAGLARKFKVPAE